MKRFKVYDLYEGKECIGYADNLRDREELRMKKISLKEIAIGIRVCEFAPKKWAFDTIEQVDETKATSFGKMTKYLVTIKFNAARYADNGMQFQVNHYEDSDSYSIFYDGSVYLG